MLHGDGGVLEVSDVVRRLARRFAVRETVPRSWRRMGEALPLQLAGIGPWCSSRSRTPGWSRFGGPARRDREQRLHEPGLPDPDRHVKIAVAKVTGRGWRLEQAGRDQNAVVALATAVYRANGTTAHRHARRGSTRSRSGDEAGL